MTWNPSGLVLYTSRHEAIETGGREMRKDDS